MWSLHAQIHTHTHTHIETDTQSLSPSPLLMTDSCGSQLISALIMKTLLNQELFFCLMQLSLSSTAWKGESRNISSSSLTLFPSLTSFPVCHSSALAALVIIWCTYCSLLTWQLSVWLLGSSSLNESLNENVVILCSPSLGFFHSVLFSFCQPSLTCIRPFSLRLHQSFTACVFIWWS